MGKKNEAGWVKMGGAAGETAHCERCGEGLKLGTQPLAVALAAMGAFTKSHARCGSRPAPQPDEWKTPSEWIRGRDTGISSCTIYTAATGNYSPWGEYDVPHDPQDFGRCYRALKLFPEWRQSLPKTVRLCAAWRSFVDAWDELTALYEAEMLAGRAPKLYQRIKELGG